MRLITRLLPFEVPPEKHHNSVRQPGYLPTEPLRLCAPASRRVCLSRSALRKRRACVTTITDCKLHTCQGLRHTLGKRTRTTLGAGCRECTMAETRFPRIVF